MSQPSIADRSIAARLHLTREMQIGILFVLFSVIGYSMLPVFTAYLRAEGMQPIPIALWRFALALPFYWLLAFARRSAEHEPDGRPLPVLRLMLNGTLFAIAALCAFYGLRIIPAGTFVVIFYTYPATVAVLSLFFGERLSGWGWVAVALTIVGVALTAPDFSRGLRGENLLGVGLALINALTVAVYFISSSRLLRGRRALTRSSAITVTGTVILLIGLSALTAFQIPQGSAWVHLLALSLFSTVLPVVSLTFGIQRLGATKAALFGTIEPLITALFAMLLIGETMQPIQWAGGLVIVASVVLLQTLGTRAEAANADTPVAADGTGVPELAGQERA